MAVNAPYRHPWPQRLAYAIFMAVLVGFCSAVLHPNPSWIIVANGVGGGFAWFFLWPLVKPRRPWRDRVSEESLAATEEAIRFAETEIENRSDRTE